jgi:hypothetical protein
MNQVRHYRNLAKMRQVLPYYLNKYKFESVRDCLARIDADAWELRTAERVQQMSLPAWDAHSPVAQTFLSARNSESEQSLIHTAGVSRNAVTIVIPCYNEAQTLPFLSGTLDAVEHALSDKYHVEFLFVDDGSSDDTWQMLQNHFGMRPGCWCLRHEVNQGITAALFTGLKAAETEIVCSIDCDCSYDPLELAQMIPLLADGVDVVTASPYHPAGGVKNVPGWRLWLSSWASWLYPCPLSSADFSEWPRFWVNCCFATDESSNIPPCSMSGSSAPRR